MYRIVLAPKNGGEPVTIDNDTYGDRSRKTISPQLELEENAFGSLTLIVPSFNAYYSSFDVDELSMAEIRVYHDNELKPVFRGRLLEVKCDSQKNRTVIFEGELSYLADTVQEPAEYKEVTPAFVVEKVLAVHNRKSPQQFKLGNVTVKDNDSADHITGRVNRGSYSFGYNDTTWSVLQSLVSQHGGYFKVRWEDGIRYLDYLKDHEDTCTQSIELGSNLLDYAEEWSLAELYTVAIPLGANVKTGKTDENGNEISEELTVASVNNGSPYILDRTDIIERYGRREKAIKFSGIADPYHLYQIGALYLNNIQFDNMVLNLTALDLHELGLDYERIKFQSVVHATATPFGLDKDFPVTKMSIPLKDPAHAVYTMSTNARGIRSISDKITDIYDDMDDAVDGVSDEIEDLKNEIEKKTAEQAADPDDWMFGIPTVVYPNDEFSGNLLYHMSFAVRGWDVGRGWDEAVSKEYSYIAGVTPMKQSLNIMLPEMLLTEHADSDATVITHAPIPGADKYGDIEKSEAISIKFTNSSCGVLPINTYVNGAQEGGCRVLYLVVKLDDSTNGVFGFSNGGSDYFFGAKDGVLCRAVNGTTYTTNKELWSVVQAQPIAGGGELPPIVTIPTDKPIVFMISHGIKNDEDYPVRSDILIGSETHVDGNLLSGVYTPTGTSSLAINGVGFKLNYTTQFSMDSDPYTSDGTSPGATPIPQVGDPDYELDFYRAVECSGVYGQITMKEAVENVAWLVGRFITGTIKSDNDGLPDAEEGS